MITRRLLVFTAVSNALFFLLHVWLGVQIHRLPLDPAFKSLLELLNGGGALFILFLSAASWAAAREAIRSPVARLVMWLGAALYCLRAASEFFVPPQVTPYIVVTCSAAGLAYAAALVLDARERQPHAGAAHQ